MSPKNTPFVPTDAQRETLRALSTTAGGGGYKGVRATIGGEIDMHKQRMAAVRKGLGGVSSYEAIAIAAREGWLDE